VKGVLFLAARKMVASIPWGKMHGLTIPASRACAWHPARYFSCIMKEVLTHNLPAKLVALVLATLLWAVIKRSQIAEPTVPAAGKPGMEFGAGVHGK
jgi:hypothetical protein